MSLNIPFPHRPRAGQALAERLAQERGAAMRLAPKREQALPMSCSDASGLVAVIGRAPQSRIVPRWTTAWPWSSCPTVSSACINPTTCMPSGAGT